jgi:hypothetical protein
MNEDDEYAEAPGFIPTRIELIELWKFWYREYLKVQLCEYIELWVPYVAAGVLDLSLRRAGRLAPLLTKQQIEKAEDEVRQSFQKTYEPFTKDDWRVFFEGTPEEREKLQKKHRIEVDNL